MTDVRDNESLFLPRKNEQQSFRSPRETLYDTIKQIQAPDLRQSLKNELKRLITDYNRLVSMLQQQSEVLETENGQLKQAALEHQRRYEKAVREMQFFRRKYEKQKRPRSLSIESGSSDLVDRGNNNKTVSKMITAKTYPLTPTSPQPSTSLLLDETSATTSSLSSQQPSQSSSASTNLSSEYSMLRYDCPLPPPPSQIPPPPPPPQVPPPPTPARFTNTSSLIQQRRVDPLVFGGPDALWEAIAKSNGSDATVEKIVSNFLRRGGSPNTAKLSTSANTVKYGYGMIHALIVNKILNSLNLLLEQGANPNAMTLSQVEDDKVTPCYLAASVGWLPGIQKLVQAGGDLMAARGAGAKNKTVLHVAAEHCHSAIVEYIVNETQGKLNLEEDNNGATVLHYACASGHTDLISFLVRSCKIPVNHPNHRGELPLHWAASNGRLEVVTLLIERYGCDMNAYVPRKVGTPLDLAKANSHRRVVDYLKGLGALTSKKLEKRREE